MKSFDELVDMLDIVFKWLSTYSHDNPDFSKIEEGLKAHNFSKGELDDCLKTLYLDGYIYFMDDKKVPIVSDVIGFTYTRNLNYLISFKGKVFLKVEGGYKTYQQRLSTERTQKALNDRRLVRWTKGLTLATILAVVLLVAWEILKACWIEPYKIRF